MRLFCLPYAGGSAPRVYRGWTALLPDSVDVRPLELPGRGARMAQTPCTSVDALVDDLVPTVLAALDGGPYALFGHSLGGLLAFELARRLEHVHGRPPAHLLVSAFEAPDAPTEPDRDHLLPDDAFRARLRELAGTPQEVLDNDDLMDLLIPVLRADFTASNTYRLTSPWLTLTCPLTVFGGLDDPEAPPHTLRAWRHRTSGHFRLHLLPGDHFFLHTESVPLTGAVRAALAADEAAVDRRRERRA
ncbi:thioesterase II family protein [Streptomyces flavalbus]|uniref:Thioesterase II family protein n=1 Tax=Streptomyces flavalbus TaxID=2665155 RepID=A0ABW2WKW7_9ACTN